MSFVFKMQLKHLSVLGCIVRVQQYTLNVRIFLLGLANIGLARILFRYMQVCNCNKNLLHAVSWQ